MGIDYGLSPLQRLFLVSVGTINGVLCQVVGCVFRCHSRTHGTHQPAILQATRPTRSYLSLVILRTCSVILVTSTDLFVSNLVTQRTFKYYLLDYLTILTLYLNMINLSLNSVITVITTHTQNAFSLN